MSLNYRVISTVLMIQNKCISHKNDNTDGLYTISIGLLIIFEGCTGRKYAEIYENKRRYISYRKTNSTERGMGVSVWFGSQIGQAKTTSKWQKTTTNVKYILWVDRASNRMFIWPNFRLPMFSNVFSCKMRNTPRRQDDWGRVDGLRSFKYEATFDLFTVLLLFWTLLYK